MLKLARTVVVAGASLALATGMVVAGGNVAPSEATTNPCAVSLRAYPVLKQGSKGQAATILECKLAKSTGVKRNGSISSTEVNALKKFQGSKGLSRTGTTNRSTWAALLSAGSRPVLPTGATGAHVVRLQESLTGAGYPTPATGKVDAATAKSVKDYKTALGFGKPNGSVTESVWKNLQAGKAGDRSRLDTTASATRTASGSTKAQKAVDFAHAQLGKSYRAGGTGPSAYDCSGLTQATWKAAGLSIPRTSQQQYSGIKTKVSKSQLRPGDLVFYYSGRSHVGIYVGDGKIIHSSRPGKPVSKVSVDLMPINGMVRPSA